jgi:hypothetical protein
MVCRYQCWSYSWFSSVIPEKFRLFLQATGTTFILQSTPVVWDSDGFLLRNTKVLQRRNVEEFRNGSSVRISAKFCVTNFLNGMPEINGGVTDVKRTQYTNCAVHITHSTRTAQYTSHIVHELHSTHHTLYTNCAVHITQYMDCTVHITHSTRTAQYTSHTVHELRCTQHQTREESGGIKNINAYIVRGTDDTHIMVVTQWRLCRWLIVGLSPRRPGINQTPVSLPVLPCQYQSTCAQYSSVYLTATTYNFQWLTASLSNTHTHTHTHRHRAVWLVVINFSEPPCTRLYGFNPKAHNTNLRSSNWKLNSEINKYLFISAHVLQIVL